MHREPGIISFLFLRYFSRNKDNIEFDLSKYSDNMLADTTLKKELIYRCYPDKKNTTKQFDSSSSRCSGKYKKYITRREKPHTHDFRGDMKVVILSYVISKGPDKFELEITIPKKQYRKMKQLAFKVADSICFDD